jgi:two-component sensor histidine kinase
MAMDGRSVSAVEELEAAIDEGLAIIAGISRLEPGRATESGTGDFLSGVRERIDSVARLFGFLRRGGSEPEVDLAAFLSLLASGVDIRREPAGGGEEAPELRLDLSAARIAARHAVPVGLVAAELLRNSFEHAYPSADTGTVTLRLRSADEGIEFGVEDDGIGLPAGVGFSGTGGLGFEIVDMVVARLKGSVERGPGRNGRGTAFSVRIPHDAGRGATITAAVAPLHHT